MARTSIIAPAMSRQSSVADRPGPASSSPFRSRKAGHRIVAARAMIEKRKGEIRKLERALDVADNVKVQRILANRLLASRNNLASWETYMEHHESVPGAVIIPTTTRSH